MDEQDTDRGPMLGLTRLLLGLLGGVGVAEVLGVVLAFRERSLLRETFGGGRNSDALRALGAQQQWQGLVALCALLLALGVFLVWLSRSRRNGRPLGWGTLVLALLVAPAVLRLVADGFGGDAETLEGFLAANLVALVVSGLAAGAAALGWVFVFQPGRRRVAACPPLLTPAGEI